MMAEVHRQLAATLAAAAMLALSACNSGDSEPTNAAAEGPDQTMVAALAGSEDHSIVSQAMNDAGLANVFNGAASYTILAPHDAAFDALGDAGTELRKPEQRAAMVAILRDHIVPGYLTPR